MFFRVRSVTWNFTCRGDDCGLSVMWLESKICNPLFVLLSIPAVIGALVLEIVKLNPGEFSAGMVGMGVLGFIAAAVTGCFCIKMMLKL